MSLISTTVLYDYIMHCPLTGTVYIQTTSALLIVSGFCVYSVASALFMFPIMHKYYSQALTVSYDQTIIVLQLIHILCLYVAVPVRTQ